MLALHIECLTRRYLPHRLNLLEGLLGLSLGMLCALEGRGKLGLSRLRVKLQSLVLLHESLELLLHLVREVNTVLYIYNRTPLLYSQEYVLPPS